MVWQKAKKFGTKVQFIETRSTKMFENDFVIIVSLSFAQVIQQASNLFGCEEIVDCCRSQR